MKSPTNTAKIFPPKKQGAQQSDKKIGRELAPPSDYYPGLVALFSF
jgi:hypothetical protein